MKTNGLFSWDKLVTSQDKDAPTSRRVFLCPESTVCKQVPNTRRPLRVSTQTISSGMSGESYFSEPSKCFDCAETQKQPSEYPEGWLSSLLTFKMLI